MVFAYEPEAAALFTQYDFLQGDVQFCYLVVDCGGGTVDIAAHKITKQDGNIVINDIAPPHGGNCGGFAVNDQFERLLIDILNIPSEEFKQLKINCAVQWNTLMNEKFEYSKISLDPDDEFSAITLQVPTKIYDEIEKITGKPLEDLIDEYGNENIEWDEDESGFVLNYPVIENLFKPVLDDICGLIKTVLAKEKCNKIETILLVGGFAESANLFQRIETTFGSKYHVNRSSTPAYSVVKGAVLCGQQERLIKPLLENMDNQPTTLEPHNEYADTQPVSDSTQFAACGTPPSVSQPPIVQTGKHLPPSRQPVNSPMETVKHLPPALTKHLPIILSRKMKHTIGVETVEKFKVDNHDVNKLVLIDKEQYCKDIFFPLVRANESVHAGSPKRVHKFLPATEKQCKCVINIFASEQEDVKYIDDEGCQHRAKVEIDIPECDTNLSREVHLCVNFYNTEVEIEAYSMINSEVKERVAVEYQFFHAQS